MSSKTVYRTPRWDFKDWLSQHIWVSDMEKAQRKTYIPMLYDSLTHFMKSKGYVMDGRWSRGPMIVAHWLYAIHVHEVARQRSYEPIGYPKIQHRDWEEDRDVFDYTLDVEVVEEFIDEWKTVEDFNVETRQGFRTQVELPTFLYTYVDIESSRQGKKLARQLELSDVEGSDKEEYEDLMSGAFGTTKKILGYNAL
jgi:hypothetical protein